MSVCNDWTVLFTFFYYTIASFFCHYVNNTRCIVTLVLQYYLQNSFVETAFHLIFFILDDCSVTEMFCRLSSLTRLCLKPFQMANLRNHREPLSCKQRFDTEDNTLCLLLSKASVTRKDILSFCLLYSCNYCIVLFCTEFTTFEINVTLRFLSSLQSLFYLLP